MSEPKNYRRKPRITKVTKEPDKRSISSKDNVEKARARLQKLIQKGREASDDEDIELNDDDLMELGLEVKNEEEPEEEPEDPLSEEEPANQIVIQKQKQKQNKVLDRMESFMDSYEKRKQDKVKQDKVNVPLVIPEVVPKPQPLTRNQLIAKSIRDSILGGV